MMDFNTVCDRCHYRLGEHKTMELGWASGSGEKTRFWQQGLCPDYHNMMQPSWDMYLFQYKIDGKLVFPFEDIAHQKWQETRKKVFGA